MGYRLVVVDVDGTLVGADSQPAPGAAAAVRAAEARGIRVALSTGRTPAACQHLLAELPLSGPHSFFDGSLVLDPRDERVLLARQVEVAATRRVLEFARRHDLTFELYTRDGYYVSAITPEVVAHAALQGCQPTVADLEAILTGGAVVKAELLLASDAARARLRAFEPELAGQLRFSWATAPGLPALSFINVVAPGATKGTALEAIAAALDLPLSSVVAIGDSANDLPMLAVAGLSIAMGNASATVRQAAQVVTGHVEAGGLADAFARYVLPSA